ncbi:MAG TPA: sugar phosphate isomerase/epimerase [Vicinamibacterales bacterium]|nr:sugar phosphate isomerase/epimerase [Vicinamibacterales bacterium]
MAGAARVLASTTSHKREPLLPTLEIFARLGLQDVDLNLHHLLEKGEPIARVAAAVAKYNLRVRVVSGGWCDFYDRAPKIDETFRSVARQVAIANALGVDMVRLFFGRLARADYSPTARQTVVANLSRLSDAHPHVTFVFENHDGASLDPEVTVEVLGLVARPNMRMNFDPINFAKVGVDPLDALGVVRPLVSHVHLKGLERGDYCEFGEGDVDLAPVLQSLVDGGYGGRFTVEYEGPADGTLRLYRSVERARMALGG